jgi:hypothetical protein
MKEKLQIYCASTYIRSGVNQMGILKNSKELLANLKAQNFSQIDGIKTYYFSTIYTTIPSDKLNSRLLDIIDNCFFKKKREQEIFIAGITLFNNTLIPHISTLKLKLKRCWSSS